MRRWRPWDPWTDEPRRADKPPLFKGPYFTDGLSQKTKNVLAEHDLFVPKGERPPIKLTTDMPDRPADLDLRASLGAEMRTRRARVKAERMSFMDWAQKVPEPKSGPLDFKRYPFQVELYAEASFDKEMVIRKCSQVGISAWLLRWAMYWADMRGLTALYVFPKLKQMFDFSDARIGSAIAKSEYLLSRTPKGTVQNKGLKQIGSGFCYFRGSESEDDLESVDADVLALDEYDRLTPENIPVAEKRIAASRLGLTRRVGVPSIPGWGTDRLYQDTDQRRWMVKCRCGEEQHLTWGANVDLERGIRICARCQEEITGEQVAAGRWVAEYPDRDVRGYALNRLVVPHVDVSALIRTSEGTLPEQKASFWNRDMGEAYSPASGRLSLEAIQAAQSAGETHDVAQQEGYRGDAIVTMGVDVASTRNLNVRISARLSDRMKRALWIGEVDSFDVLDELMQRYQVHMACIDHLPEYRLANAFAERFPGRVMIVRYAASVMGRVLSFDDVQRAVTVRRVDAIDAMMDAIRGQRNLLPPDLPPGYTDQLQALQRVVELDGGRKTVKYVSTGRDDYAHAETYDGVAWEAFLYRSTVEAETAETYSDLDQHLDWQRTVLHAEGDGEYVELTGSDYSAGPGDEYAEYGESF